MEKTIFYSRKTIYLKLRELHQKHACKEFLENFKFLERFCNYSENNIPQLEEISRFLKGWVISTKFQKNDSA